MQIGLKDSVETSRQEKALAREILFQQRETKREEKLAAEASELLDRKWAEEQEQSRAGTEEGEDPGYHGEGLLSDWDVEVKGDHDFLPPGGSF